MKTAAAVRRIQAQRRPASRTCDGSTTAAAAVVTPSEPTVVTRSARQPHVTGACSVSRCGRANRSSSIFHSCAATAVAITVGSIDPKNDTRDPNTAFGTCLKLFAPGVNILSAWNTNDTATNTDSGTSMAAAHVTGVAARYLENHQMASPAAVWNAIHYAN